MNQKSRNITFTNSEGIELSAHMEFPPDIHPKAYAIFAHCFTCSKNLLAAKNLTRSMAKEGIAVLRFDFTGLGESQGDFEDSNFSSNVSDLLAASQFLESEFEAPQVIIGHSLGGAAVIYAASKLESIRAVATVGAPASVDHVVHLLEGKKEEVMEKGEADVKISGRKFKIKKQFLEDIESKNLEKLMSDFRKPILIMHSPQDEIVSVDNAAKLYDMAWHPKSFVSLDGADHLLSKKKDSLYVGQLIASWSSRYVDEQEEETPETDHRVVAQLTRENNFTTTMKAGKHSFLADEPEDVGGDNLGPNPYDLLASALAACTAMTIKMYSDRKEWKLEQVNVHVDHKKSHKADCEECEKKSSRIDHFERSIEIDGDLSDEQCSRLLEIANKCPVHKTLETENFVDTFLKQTKDDKK